MASNEGFRKYVEAGAVLGQITRARAEEVVRELVGAGEVQRGQAQHWVDDLVERSRKASEELVHLIRAEVSSQLGSLGVDPEDLAKQVAEILKHSAGVGRKATSSAASTAGTTVSRTASATKQAAARAAGVGVGAKKTAKKVTKKASVKKAAKAPVKKAAAKRAPAKKAPAKRAPGTSSGTVS